MNGLKIAVIMLWGLLPIFGLAIDNPSLQKLQALTQSGEGVDRIKAYRDYSQALQDLHQKEAVIQAEKALQISRELGDIQEEALSLRNYLEVCIDFFELNKAEEQLPHIQRLKPKVADSLNQAFSILAGRIHLLAGNYTLARPLFKGVLAEALNNNDKKAEADARTFMGEVYRYQGKYPEALSEWLTAMSYFEAKQDSPSIVDGFMGLGIIHYMMKEGIEAESYFQKALDWYEKEGDSTGIGFAETTLGLAYYIRDSLDQAITHAYRSYQIRDAINDTRGKGESLNNLSLIYMRKGAWNEAKGYLEASLQNLEEGQDFRQIPTILTNLGICYKNLGDTEQAENLFQTALVKASAMGADDARSTTYRHLANLAEETADYKKAFEYAMLHKNLKDSLKNIEKERFILELRKQYDSDKTRLENERLKMELVSRKRERYGLLAIGLLSLLVILLLLNRQRLRANQAKVLHENEKKTLEAREQLANVELSHARKALQQNEEKMKAHMAGILEKNNLIENLEAQIKAIEVKDNEAETERSKRLADLRQMKILTEENWRSFRHHFEQVYHGFLDKLMKQYPDLTKGERRLFVLVKLNLSTTEMADILGISADSVKKARYRLRKKLQLTEDQPLTPFIQNFR